jgi:hypothetical protein
MTKQENKLKARVLSLLRKTAPTLVVFPHQDVRRNGIPDISVTGGGLTTWWEFKHATPSFVSNGYQELTAQRLSRAGFCRYIVFREYEDETKETFILLPGSLNRDNWIEECDYWSDSFNYAGVVQQIMARHKL